MRRNEWILLSSVGLMFLAGGCKHSEPYEGPQATVTTHQNGIVGVERAEAQPSESTRTSATHETGAATAEDVTESANKPAYERYASGSMSSSSSRYSSSGGDRYASGAGMNKKVTTTDRSREEQAKTDQLYQANPQSEEKTIDHYSGSSAAQAGQQGASRPQSGHATAGKAMPGADQTATLVSVSPAAQVNGSVGLKKTKSGATLIVDLVDAAPGRYLVQMLGAGTCATIDDINPRPSEEATTGAKSAAPKIILGHIDVNADRTGHTELTLTSAQVGAKSFDDLQQHLVVIREDRKAASANGSTTMSEPDTGIMSCGTLEATHAG